MKNFYDFHIHSGLSPCGSDDMTPNNIVNMCHIKGLNVISVTDHNTTDNVQIISELCRNVGIMSIPGIEVTTREEVHVLCYFKELYNAKAFGNLIYDSLPEIKNIPSIFGNQNIYNINDEIIGTLDKLLLNASQYSLKEIRIMVDKYHGIMVPAHINKKSNSILGILGFIPYDLDINFIEIYSKSEINENHIKELKVLKNSDAHNLIDISEAENFIELNNIYDIYDYLLFK